MVTNNILLLQLILLQLAVHNIEIVVCDLGVLRHFAPKNIFGLGGIRILWAQKCRCEKLLKFT